MTNRPSQAVAHCRRQSKSGQPLKKVGMCKRETRLAYDIESDGSPNAKTAYARTDHKFTGQWIPGAFAWWAIGDDWHVAICAFRKGWVWSVDFKRAKFWDRVPLNDITVGWNAKFLGFSRDLDGKTVVKVPRIARRYP